MKFYLVLLVLLTVSAIWYTCRHKNFTRVEKILDTLVIAFLLIYWAMALFYVILFNQS